MTEIRDINIYKADNELLNQSQSLVQAIRNLICLRDTDLFFSDIGIGADIESYLFGYTSTWQLEDTLTSYIFSTFPNINPIVNVKSDKPEELNIKISYEDPFVDKLTDINIKVSR